MTHDRGVRLTVVAGKTAVLLTLLGYLAPGSAQTQKPSGASAAFGVVSVKRDPGGLDTHVGSAARYQTQFPDYKGRRLSGETQLGNWVYYAFYPLRPDREEFANGSDSHEFYQIEALAPPGTTVDEARLMLRKVLVDRLGLQYRMVDRETPVFNLVRGVGPLKLAPAVGPHQSPLISAGGRGGFKGNAASIADFAGFLSTIAGRSVVDKTGLAGNYQFDVDWNKEIAAEAAMDPHHGIDPGIAIEGVKKFGLKLEAGKESRQFLVVEHVNKEPTPN